MKTKPSWQKSSPLRQLHVDSRIDGNHRAMRWIFLLAASITVELMLLPTAQASASETVSPQVTESAAVSQSPTSSLLATESETIPRQPVSPNTRLSPRRKVRRTREDIRRERQDLLDRTNAEIDAIIVDFHQKLPRDQAQAIGAAYARYSSRFQHSIADQLRALFAAAVQQGIFIPRNLVFFDLAVRGSKNRRPGLDALRQAIEQSQFQVLFVFTTSRLFRKAYRAMQFVEEQLVERGIRGIFLRSGLDTSDPGQWRLMFQMLSAMDEAQVHMYAEHIRASHEGLFMRQMVWTTLPLGFTGEEVPGEFTRRKLPRKKIIIDEATADWIKKIFHWYVVEGMTRDNIARELNDDANAPIPTKCLTGLWTSTLVRNHLMNPAYRGEWCYGTKESQWLSEKDYCRQVPRVNPLKSAYFGTLQIIDDTQWYEAQQRLAAEKADSGRRSRNEDHQSQPRFLRGLFFCVEHGRQLVVGGPQGQVLLCPLCRSIKAEKRPLFSHLNRQLALQRTCATLAELVRADNDLVLQVIAACQQAATNAQQPDPDVLRRLRAQSNRISSSIDFNRRNPGETDMEQRQTELVLRDLRRQLNDVSAELAAHESAVGKEIVIPEPEEVMALFNELAEILSAAASAKTDEQMQLARRIIDDLTGGRIELCQMGERKAQRGWLQGRFRLDIVNVAFARLTGSPFTVDNGPPVEIVIDYRKLLLIDEQMEEAKQLWDQDLLNKVIARKMKRSATYVTMLIQRWFTSRGLPCPDGRKRRAAVLDKQIETPVYKELADDVVELVEKGWSNLSIARKLHTSDVTVGKAIAWWFNSRGLSVPSAADRRRKMLLQAKAMLEAGGLLKDIAAELSYSPRGLKLALGKLYIELGEVLKDGRTLRGNTASGETINRGAHPDHPGDQE